MQTMSCEVDNNCERPLVDEMYRVDVRVDVDYRRAVAMPRDLKKAFHPS